MKKRSKTAFLLLLFTLLVYPACADTPSKISLKREWGIWAFPALEQYNFIDYYLKFRESYIAAIDETVALGVTRSLVAKTWREIETDKGKLDIEDLQDNLNLFQERGQKTFFGFQMINTVKKETPADLMDTAWDAPEMKARAISALDKVLSLMPASGAVYVSFGNEVDVYFEKHLDEVVPFRELFKTVRDAMRQKYPDVVFGVTATYEGYFKRRDIITDINRDTDVMMLTYYPLLHGNAKTPEAPYTDLPEMVRFANGKPLMLQEVGYPSSTQADSSQEDQAEFLRHFFKAWEENAAAIPYIVLFLQHDLNKKVCNDLTSYYGLEEIKKMFQAQICTLGLKDAYGKPKQAWKVLTDDIAPTIKNLDKR